MEKENLSNIEKEIERLGIELNEGDEREFFEKEEEVEE